MGSLAETFKQIALADDLDSASTLAAILNADRVARLQYTGQADYQALDVVRLGHLLLLYEQFTTDAYGGQKAVEQALTK